MRALRISCAPVAGPTRLETEPSRSLDGPSLWWSRRIRRALLVEALDDAAAAAAAATAAATRPTNASQGATDAASGDGDVQQPRLLLSSAVEEWLDRELKGGPF